MSITRNLAALLLSLLSFSLYANNTEQPKSLQQNAADAYIYGYPLVLMDITRQVSLKYGALAGDQLVRSNQLVHTRAFPDHRFTAVVRPNADTLYSNAWIDLSEGPVVLSAPDTQGRWYQLQLLDAWSNVFASPGKRTTGTAAQDFAITGPDWQGALPEGLTAIEAPTNTVWLIGRTQTNNKKDYAAVHQLQDQFDLKPLKNWLDPSAGRPAEPHYQISAEAPVQQIAALSAEQFFSQVTALMQHNPPAAADAPILAAMAELGLQPGQPFDLSAQPADVQQALHAAPKLAQTQMMVFLKQGIKPENGWTILRQGIGSYGTHYLPRAVIAMVGLGANLPEDAIYPLAQTDGNGEPFNGQHRYRIHFTKAQLPPVQAFWSLTLYNDQAFFSDNPIGRYAIGDRDPLRYNPDGSLDLLIQHQRPQEGESNWLPAPADAFDLVLRLYWPKTSVLDGSWQIPPVERLTD